MIDVPRETWNEAMKEATRWMQNEVKTPMARTEAARTWYIYLSVALGARMNLPAGVFGEVVSGGPHNKHLTRLENVRVV